jgi:hypothetical protein
VAFLGQLLNAPAGSLPSAFFGDFIPCRIFAGFVIKRLILIDFFPIEMDQNERIP